MKQTMPMDLAPTAEQLTSLMHDFETALSRKEARELAQAENYAGGGSQADATPALDRLMAMEGLDSVKEAIRSQLYYAKIMKMRAELGLKTPERIYNIILTGNPGTGKTTVAKLIGKIFHEAGLISKGHTVLTNRAGLLGRFIGDTEYNTMVKINEARGGVLCIDEIYSLNSEVSDSSEGSRDFGVKVIDTLMTELSDPKSDVIVIGCGYRKEMLHFLKANPGLASRFPVVLDFEDFSVDQLWSIVKRRLRDYDFTVSEEAETAIRQLIGQASAIKNFGNGRFAVTLVENHLIPALCSRICNSRKSAEITPARMKKLSVVEKEDVPSVEMLFPLTGRSRSVVGFK